MLFGGSRYKRFHQMIALQSMYLLLNINHFIECGNRASSQFVCVHDAKDNLYRSFPTSCTGWCPITSLFCLSSSHRVRCCLTTPVFFSVVFLFWNYLNLSLRIQILKLLIVDCWNTVNVYIHTLRYRRLIIDLWSATKKAACGQWVLDWWLNASSNIPSASSKQILFGIYAIAVLCCFVYFPRN